MQNGLKKVFLTSALLGSLSCVYAQPKVVGSFAFVGMAMDYNEYDEEGVWKDSETSNLSQILGFEMGLGFLLHETRESYSYINFNLLNVAGETDYDGYYLISGLPATGTTTNVIADFDVDYMYHNILSDTFEISYGLGLGYRYWERKLSASQIEIYEWFSLRPKVGAAFMLTPELRLGLDLEYQYGLNPTMSESYYGLDFDLGAADILKVSLPVTYQYSSAMDFFIEGVYERQEIEASNVKSGFYEPDSTANNTYLKLGFVYKY